MGLHPNGPTHSRPTLPHPSKNSMFCFLYIRTHTYTPLPPLHELMLQHSQMGLQNHLSDVSSESVVILTAVLLAKTLRYLRSLLGGLFHRPSINNYHYFNSSPYDVVGCGLAGVILLCEQSNLNRLCSYPNRSVGSDADSDSDCVVCLNRMGDGDYVRKLACSHVFHKDCFEGWLDHLNFDCPLCRAPLVSDEWVDCTRRRVAGDLLAWFPIQ